jgi:signal transduction histidine kinase
MHLLKFILILYLLLFCFVAQAQDTALQRILSLPDDTAKVDQLNAYSNKLIDTDIQKATVLCQQSLALAAKLNYPGGTGAACIAIGYANAVSGNHREAIRNYQAAITQFQKAGRIDQVARCVANIGVMYEILGKPDSTMHCYMQAAQTLENTTDSVSLGHVYSSIGVLHGNNKNYPKALFYKSKALAIARQQQNAGLLVEVLTELADTYGEMNQPQKGISFAYEALPLAKQINTAPVLATMSYTLSALQAGLHRADSAIHYARRAIHYASITNDKTMYTASALNLAEGYNLQNRQPERLTVLKEALQQGTKAGAILVLDDVYKNMADAHYKLGQYRDAYEAYINYTLYKDSALNETRNRTIAELQVKYETAQNEKVLSQKQLQLTQKDLQIQRSYNYLYYTIAGLVVALLVTALMLLQSRHKKLVHAKQLQAVEQQKELQLLQAVMQGEERERSRIAKDLHDGVAGMLAAVKMHFSSIPMDCSRSTHTEGYLQGMHLLNEAAAEVRKTSHNLMPEVLFQHGLDEALRRYCSSLYNSKTLQVQYDSWGAISRFKDSFELSVYRIVQELINNIIKHSKASLATVQLNQQESLLCISIEDNGVGFGKPEAITDGMGLRSLRSRIKAMNGRMEMNTDPASGVTAYLEFETAGLEKESNLPV